MKHATILYVHIFIKGELSNISRRQFPIAEDSSHSKG